MMIIGVDSLGWQTHPIALTCLTGHSNMTAKVRFPTP